MTEPRAEGHRPVWQDDVPTGWCECGAPYPHMTVAATPPAEGLDYWRERALAAENQTRIRDATPPAEGLDADRLRTAIAAKAWGGRAGLTTCPHCHAPLGTHWAATPPAEGREALWAMWTSGEKLAYGCGYRDGRNAARVPEQPE